MMLWLFCMHVQKAKPKLGMVESAKFLLNSRYIRDLATLVVAYGISINLVEVTWKSKLKLQVSTTQQCSKPSPAIVHVLWGAIVLLFLC